jgi:hypothetical protein
VNAYITIAIGAFATVVYFVFKLMLSKVEQGAKAEEKLNQADVDKKRADEMIRIKLLRTLLTILIMVAFSGCQSTGGSGCPPLVEYSADTQKRVAAELRALPKDSPLARMIVDYKKTRDACRIQ